ncbi:MAG: hypothetical protein LRS48_04710 [Desulfurococcales archaeon]|nr:hypothetical protein [Desulfurococcales archaeon]
MAGKGSGKKNKKAGGGLELEESFEALILRIEKYSTPITLVLLFIILALGIYIRIIPALNYGIHLDASDPWIVYWEAKYFLDHGLTSFSGLKHVTQFWWPIGRDFLHTDYMGMPWLAAATYPIGKAFGLTLQQWVALFPVFAGAAGIILIFALTYYLTGSKLAALSGAAFFAFLPGSIVRTTVGFVEKIGFSIPFISAFYLGLFAALRNVEKGRTRRAIIYSIVGGLIGGSIANIWGGFPYVFLSLALIVALDPIIGGFSENRFKIYVITSLSVAAAAVAAPRVTIGYFFTNIGAALTAALLLYAVELWANKTGLAHRVMGKGIDWRFHAWLITVGIALGLILLYGGAINLRNPRLLQTIGIRYISPLQNSVQENQPTPITTILKEYGLPLFFALAGIAAYAYNLYTGRYKDTTEKIGKFFFYVFAIIAVLFNKELAYYTQISSYYAVLAGAAGISDLIHGSIEETVQKGKWRKIVNKNKKKEVADPIRVMMGVFIILIVVFGVAYTGRLAYTQNKYRAPQILTSGLGPLAESVNGHRQVIVPINNAWLNALKWIKENTPPNATIVSWWDYGFWITVNTGRKTVADGATFNETQIRYLAEALTGTEGTASYIFKYKLDLVPNDTYVVFYEVFNGIYNIKNNYTIMYPMLSGARKPASPDQYGIITHGVADFGKSVQMLKIAYRIPPYSSMGPFFTQYSSIYVDRYGYKYLHFPGFVGEPKQNVTTVLNTLLYKLGMWGIIAIPQYGIYDGNMCSQIFKNSTFVYPYVIASLTGGPGGGPQLSDKPIIPPPLKYFRPVAISVSCPVVKPDYKNGVITFTAVVVFIYQWTY